MPIVDLTDDEHAAVTAAIRRLIEDDKFPMPAPRPAEIGAGEARRHRSRRRSKAGSRRGDDRLARPGGGVIQIAALTVPAPTSSDQVPTRPPVQRGKALSKSG